MKKIVFTLVALVGFLSASEYLKISDNVVMVSTNNSITSVFKVSDIAYMVRDGNKNMVVLKQPANAIIHIESDYNQNDIAKAYVDFLSRNK